MSDNFILVFCTVPDINTAEKIADILISKKQAACCNIIQGLTSIYSWEGKVNKDSELLLLIKSKRNLFNKVEKTIKQIHPYDVPEVISIDIAAGSKDYLNWMSTVVSKS